MIQLRDYQSKALEDLNRWFIDHPEGHPIVSACVGAGKSVMIAEFCHRAVLDYPGYRSRILMLVPSKELLRQNLEKLQHLADDIYIGIVSASHGRKDVAFDKDVVIATVGSVIRNPGQLGRLDIILVDECHLISRKEEGQYRQLISACQKYNPALRVIGLTGTPYRGNGVWLTEGDERLFTGIAARVTMRELLDQGYLSPLVNAQTETHIDATGVKMKDGDFVISDLAKRIDQEDLTRTIAKQIVDHGANRNKWLVYCVTVEHAHHMAEALEDLGVKVAVISAKTPAKERDDIIRDFRKGLIKCICNVAVLTTGADFPDLDLLALVRNTRSPCLYTQICGRGMRLAEGKQNCLWLDFTDTTAVMGPVDQVKGRLEPKPRKDDDKVQRAEKVCPECGNSVPTATAICPNCQYGFPPPELKVNKDISGASILSEIKFETYDVNRVTYSYHRNPNKMSAPPTLRVTYWSGLRRLCSEWVCFEHEGIARDKARLWWRSRTDMLVPEDVNEAMNYSDCLAKPNKIVVREGGKYPELVRCVFEEVSA